jgi:hypothetical protein
MSQLNRATTEEPLEIRLRDRNEVFAFAQRCVVPFHIDGRKSIDTEKWILGRYLLARADAGLLRYPLTAIHAEQSKSPDYMLLEPSGRIGLEITEASTPEFHRELINNERGIDNHYELRPGWLSNQAEREWALVAFEAIQRKAAKLARGDWNPADAYDLAVYDNGPAPVFDSKKACEFLRTHLFASQRSGFRRVSIVTAGATQLLYDVEGEGRTLPIAPV